MPLVFKKGITGFDSDQFISESSVKSFLKTIKFPFIPDFKNCIAPHQSSNFWVIPIVNLLDLCEFNLIINSSY